MSGNLWEWNEDWYHNTYTGAPADGSAWVDTGSYRVLRGGSFGDDAAYVRAAERNNRTPGYRVAYIGARCWRP
jgi:formylglycine-generating enzyme required for sulfatase activity